MGCVVQYVFALTLWYIFTKGARRCGMETAKVFEIGRSQAIRLHRKIPFYVRRRANSLNMIVYDTYMQQSVCGNCSPLLNR